MAICPMCRKETASVVHETAERWMLEHIRADHPQWVETDEACPKCWAYYRSLETVVRWEGGGKQ